MQDLNQTMMITLRDADPNDEQFLMQVFACTRAAEVAQVPWTDEQKAAFMQMQCNAQHSYYHEQYPEADYKVILHNDEPVGRLYVNKQPDLVKILDITVLPEFRNCGIGSGLIQNILNDADEMNSSVHIYVETFSPSLSLFKKMGFSILQEEGINFLLEWHGGAASAGAP